MQNLKPDDRSLRDLFDQHKKLAGSHDLSERLKTIFVRGLLGEQLESYSNHQIGDLLSLVQDGMGIFSAEFTVTEHAIRRLQRRHSWRRMK